MQETAEALASIVMATTAYSTTVTTLTKTNNTLSDKIAVGNLDIKALSKKLN